MHATRAHIGWHVCKGCVRMSEWGEEERHLSSSPKKSGEKRRDLDIRTHLYIYMCFWTKERGEMFFLEKRRDVLSNNTYIYTKYLCFISMCSCRIGWVGQDVVCVTISLAFVPERVVALFFHLCQCVVVCCQCVEVCCRELRCVLLHLHQSVCGGGGVGSRDIAWGATAARCNTLQHTATHCNTLQRTATYCNTL